ncbi:LCP family protein [Candidatus Gracilibacteria bacterium]|nr:LCP family protein [Candidatus Gracilibacteria bacterium]
MSNFKIRKLPKEQIITTKTQEEKQKIIKRRLRFFVGFLIFLFGGFFAINLASQAIGSIHIGTNDISFTPIIFQSSTIKKEESINNILIAGIGGGGHEGSELTDSLMLARIDEKNKKVTLLSIPRDLYVAHSGGKNSGRINALYSKKQGINQLAEKVSEITGQPIHHYIVIDFTGFKYIVNALGGIDIDVPKDLIDREYPNDNWGWTVFEVRRGVQVFDGETALRYARSRHSTSDFDRSERQQLLIKAIKDKALSLEFLTSPSKIQDVLTAIRSHLNTDLTVADIIQYGRLMQEIKSDDINVYGLGNNCVALNCSAGAYLYNPAREYFNGASVLIPENASANKLSQYGDINRFTGFIFTFPNIRNEKIPLVIVHTKSNYQYARNVAISLRKLGFQFDNEGLFLESTGAIETSHINIFRNNEVDIGWKDESIVVESLKSIEEKIPYISTTHNEYVVTQGPKIEIVLGKDAQSYFTFAKPAYYLPYIPTVVSSGESASGGVVTSGEKTGVKVKNTGNKGNQSSQENQTESSSEYSVAPGEWEDFNP